MKTYFAALLFALTFASTGLSADPTNPTNAAVTSLPAGVCPLNSGGSSLLGSEWRLQSIYGNEVPAELEISLKVGDSSLSGLGGCNQYTTAFKRVGHTGFMMTGMEKGAEKCRVLPTVPGGPTINVGNWEGSYLRTLQRAGSVQQEGDKLHFYNRSGESSVIFNRNTASL